MHTEPTTPCRPRRDSQAIAVEIHGMAEAAAYLFHHEACLNGVGTLIDEIVRKADDLCEALDSTNVSRSDPQ